MTLDPTLPKANYTGDGVWKDPIVPFRIFAEDELLVQREDKDPASATYGQLTDLVRGVDYTVEINVAGDGGFVHLVVAPTVLQGILITSASVLEQQRSYGGGGAFPSKSHEAALDKLTRITQELSMRLGMSLRFPDQDPDGLSTILPPVAQRASKFLCFTPTGALTAGDPDGIVPAAEAARDAAEAAQGLAEDAQTAAETAQGLSEDARDAAIAAAASVPDDALVPADIGVTVQAYDATILKSADIGDTVQAHDADTAKTDVQQAWTKPQRATPSSVAIGSAFDASAYAAIKHTLAANTTVASPSNTPVEGDELYLFITGASTYTLAWNATYKASSTTALPSAPAAGKTLAACFRYDGTYWQLIGTRVDA